MMYEELESGEYFVTDFEGAKQAVHDFYLGMSHTPTPLFEEWCDIQEFANVTYPRVFDFSLHYPCYADGCRNPNDIPFAYTVTTYDHAGALAMVDIFVKRGAA